MSDPDRSALEADNNKLRNYIKDVDKVVIDLKVELAQALDAVKVLRPTVEAAVYRLGQMHQSRIMRDPVLVALEEALDKTAHIDPSARPENTEG